MQFSTPLTKEEKRAHNEIAALLSGTPGCNCDRWGHPCPRRVEDNVQPKAERARLINLVAGFASSCA